MWLYVMSLKAARFARTMASDVESTDLETYTEDSRSYSLRESEDPEEEESISALSTVDPYEYEPVASDSSESQEDSGGAERLNNTDWLGLLSYTLLAINYRATPKHPYIPVGSVPKSNTVAKASY